VSDVDRRIVRDPVHRARRKHLPLFWQQVGGGEGVKHASALGDNRQVRCRTLSVSRPSGTICSAAAGTFAPLVVRRGMVLSREE